MPTNSQPPPMESLPTELNELICSHLGRQSIYSLLQVSKRQQEIAEPYLYKDVSFENLDTEHIQLLLARIIDRPDLARKIKSVSLESWAPEEFSEPDECEAVLVSVVPIHSAIDSVMSRRAGRKERADACVKWLIDIFNGEMSPRKCLEASLALIVGIAATIERIAVDFSASDRFGNTFFVLLDAMKPELFSQLRHLSITLGGWRWNFEKIPSLECFANLHTLILSHSHMQLDFLDKICFNGSTPNLQHLSLEDIDAAKTALVHFEEFSAKLAQNCPKLKSLHLDLKYARQLSNLHLLVSLQEMVLSPPELLVDKDEWTSFSAARDRLPPNITSLGLLSISDWMIIEFIKISGINERDLQKRVAYRKKAAAYLIGILSSTLIKNLELHAGEFKSMTPFLQQLAEVIHRSQDGAVRFLARDDCGVRVGL